MSKIPFNVDAYTARLIGRENVSKLNGAVIELVKNTYDADASICVLYYEQSTDDLYIVDNGCGMSQDTIIKHWMTIGRSTKKSKFITEAGRVQTGAKGIGRFALDRIADKCVMFTRTTDSKWIWKVDWDEFAKHSNITEVTADLDETSIEVEEFISKVKNEQVKQIILDNAGRTGTIFKLSLLRDEWGENTIQKIRDDLTTLVPYELRNEFQLYFFDEKNDKEEAEVLNAADAFYYDYKIGFTAEEDGAVAIKIHRNEFDFRGQFEKIMKEADFSEEDREYFKGKEIEINTSFAELIPKRKDAFSNSIGKFSGVLYFSKVTSTAKDAEKYFYKSLDGRGIKRDFFNGIKIYRDGFRVRPYGEPNSSNYDWLLLAGRKNKSPAAISHKHGKWRVNTDQILGSVLISRLNISLPDQSNREGIVETKEFVLLKEFIINVIQEFENDRQYVFRKLNARYEEINRIAKLQEEINQKAKEVEEEKKRNQKSSAENPEESPVKTDVGSSVGAIDATKAKEALDYKDDVIKSLEDENRLLRTLATTGIVTNTYVHEIKDITHKLNRKIIMAKEALEFDRDMDKGLKYIQEANVMRDSMNSWFKVTIGSVSRDKRTMKKTNISNLINQGVNSWQDSLKDVKIDLDMQNQEIETRCFPYDIESIISNLIANSIGAFDANFIEEANIYMKVEEKGNEIVIKYSDSGKGLSPAYKKNPERILDPMESDKRNELGEPIGTGMGMWIINKTVLDYNGSIDLSDNIKFDEGFHVTIKLMKR